MSEEQQQESQTQAPATHGAREAMDLARVRELVLKAHPNVVPELIQGDTFDAMVASVPAAEAAYTRIREAVTGGQQQGQTQPPPTVSAGQPANNQRTFAINVEELGSEAKIAEGLRRARRQAQQN